MREVKLLGNSDDAIRDSTRVDAALAQSEHPFADYLQDSRVAASVQAFWRNRDAAKADEFHRRLWVCSINELLQKVSAQEFGPHATGILVVQPLGSRHLGLTGCCVGS